MITQEEYLNAKRIIEEYESDLSNVFLGRYVKKLDKNGVIYTLEEWNNDVVVLEMLTEDDGEAYWAKDGFRSDDDAFSTPCLDATHVVWYNR